MKRALSAGRGRAFRASPTSRHGVTADSTITARDSFDSPCRRSTKVIGTSAIVKPRRDATKSISTRKE